MRLATALLLSCVLPSIHAQTHNPITTEQPDTYKWLEDVSSDRSLDWVKAENARSAKVIQADPRYATFAAEARAILESPARLPIPDLHPNSVYNFWQDSTHVRGIYRRTTLASYLTASPDWQTVIDYDALAAKDKQEWVAHGLTCLFPANNLCLVTLSAGGEDADTQREFDLRTNTFVPGGFTLPTSKQNVVWVDKDTLLVARDWGAGSMTKSGYPYVVKLWHRGQPLKQAREIFRGTPDDVSASPVVLNDGHGHQAVLLSRGVNFFERELSLYNPSTGTVSKLALPAKLDIPGLLDNQLIVTLNQDWKLYSTTIPQGSVVALDLTAIEKDPTHLHPTVIFTPSAQEFEDDAQVTRNHLILTTLDHVQGRAYIYTRSASNRWTSHRLDLPDNLAVQIASTDQSTDQFFLATAGFLTPSALLLGDAAKASLNPAKQLPPLFDATNLAVDQLYATSTDGTRVPYFVVHRKDIAYNGANPTLINAYGGFQVSMTPTYSGVVGKLWLEHGGVYVLANIRGGGEFGPAWHEAGLKTQRQRIYDDFYAVAQDLVTRKITSPRRLGIVGGSNGGLLMGVEFTQHPELYHAVVIQVPLLDMINYEHIAAGASWVGEYGSVLNPDERTFLTSISPYNQLRPDVAYPEPLIFTTTKDDRVGPVHARKFAARLEEFHKPFLYDEIIEGGHAAGANLKEKANTWAEMYTYLSIKLVD